MLFNSLPAIQDVSLTKKKNKNQNTCYFDDSAHTYYICMWNKSLLANEIEKTRGPKNIPFNICSQF